MIKTEKAALAAMSGSKLDQIVKGAPPPGSSVPDIISKTSQKDKPLQSEEGNNTGSSASPPPSEHTASSPFSPPHIYLNLLILEASFRSQYLELRARRRQHTLFLFLLTLWIAWFSYLLFLRPREDGVGVGGSVYWVVEMGEKVALMGGVMTVLLMWGTGQWDRGVRWPRRWVGIANRGLRTMNAKIVVIKSTWRREILDGLAYYVDILATVFTFGLSHKPIDPNEERYALEELYNASSDEDLSPGGDHVKLLLLPKPFSPEFRENWELYRLEYWERENERRAYLRHILRRRERELARQEGGWFWWLRPQRRKPHDMGFKVIGGKIHQRHHSDKEGKHRQPVMKAESTSRNTSRGSTPRGSEVGEKQRSRRGSNTTSASERRKKTKRPGIGQDGQNLQMAKLSPGSPAM